MTRHDGCTRPRSRIAQARTRCRSQTRATASGMRRHRRGVTLAMVAMVMGLAAGVVALLAMYSAQAYRNRQGERVVRVTRTLIHSGVAYAQAHAAAWRADPPTEPITLDVTELVPPRMTGRLTLSFVTIEGRPHCRISARTQCGAAGAADEEEIPLEPQRGLRPQPISPGRGWLALQ